MTLTSDAKGPWRVPRLLRPIFRLTANKLLAPLLCEGLVYWRAERLYWEGVTHPDGGDHEEEAAIHAAEGAETALRRLADILGIDPGLLPDEGPTQEAGVRSLYKRLESDERAALATLDRLGPSHLIPVRERLHEYLEAQAAETMLEHLDQVSEYLEWLTVTRSNAGGHVGSSTGQSGDKEARP